jgi:predicted metalloprotease
LTEFNAQGNFWNIPGVSFAFLNDCNSPNALANPQDRSILFGTTMAAKLLRDFGNAIPLWQVLAHEWGHQIQFYLGDSWLNAPTVAPKELEADMFSGFYLLIAKNTANLSSSISNAFALGDWEFNNPAHHGTPNQRGAAVLAGGRVALEYVSGSIPRTYPAIRQRFLQELAFIL